jgi:hypothetical protein
VPVATEFRLLRFDDGCFVFIRLRNKFSIKVIAPSSAFSRNHFYVKGKVLGKFEIHVYHLEVDIPLWVAYLIELLGPYMH